VPEAIGCPEDLVLRAGEVCGSCNHGLAHIDQALVNDLEVFALMAGVPRKRGRPAKVSSYRNLQAEIRDGHTSFFFNMDPTTALINPNRRVPGFRGGSRDVRAQFQRTGNTATITFPLEFGRSPKVARALVKLGAEYLCWAAGHERAAQAIAGPITDFVVRGIGDRPVILFGSDLTKYQHHFGHIGAIDGSGLYCAFRLAHFHVMVDLSRDLLAFERIAAHLYVTLGTVGWSTLPPSAGAKFPQTV
jgi:hypothetical protein